MITDVLPHELAKRAKAHGYPQEQYPKEVWLFGGAIGPDEHYAVYWDETPPDDFLAVLDCNWCAAPSRLQVLEWLEQERAVEWSKVQVRQGSSLAGVKWYSPTHGVEAATAEELIAAIFDQLEKEAGHE